MSEQKKKPVILWTCDVVGWAYYNRIMRLSKVLTQYEHRIWYFGQKLPWAEKNRLLAEADVIVCQGVKSMRIAQIKPLDFSGDRLKEPQLVLDRRYDNIVARLDSMRVDVNGEYYDIWEAVKS